MTFNKIFQEKYLVIAFSLFGLFTIIDWSYSGYITYLPYNSEFDIIDISDFNAYYFYSRIGLLSFIIGLAVCLVKRKLYLNRFMLLSIQMKIIEIFFAQIIVRIFAKDIEPYLSLSFSPVTLMVRVYLLFLIIYCLFYFQSKRTSDRNLSARIESKSARFLNLIFDSFFLYLLFVMTFSQIRYYGYTFQNISFMNESPFVIILIHRFFYYFILESVFLQTPGKLYNGAKVFYTKNRFGSILVRSLSRLIPFDALSFFGNTGWHDSLSKTRVLLPEKENLSE